ncbi:type ISP restriction/modification enzyme [Flammeovirga pacifica]|uniref:Type ISP restriction-modification enzyme LLaBIII C-terminal specificity domain-containing protein n=1 Tax=Flammeovirga pacifica TaxID=915059 RepID=A0A1S1YXU6_FLAPC|nr:type ISP restriction/modification enzyme [Flammeovirga pacifica]OHX65834.1 hypothetical protein NH26_05450 [Flammeovirga pacifica]
MIGEAIQNIQQQLLFAGNFKNEVALLGNHLIKTFKKSFFPTFHVDDLLKMMSEHIVADSVSSLLFSPSELLELNADPIHQAFDEIYQKLNEKEVFSDSIHQLYEKINILVENGSDKKEIYTQLMGREEGEELPAYFNGMFKSLMKKHLNNAGKNAQYLYPSFTLPPFLDNESQSNTIVCYDLLVYYWCAVCVPASKRSYGNSLSFTDIQPKGQTHFEFKEEDSNLDKLINLNREPVQIVFGTIQQMSLGNRSAHKEWTSKVKKVFSGDQKRNPVSYWLLWAQKRLGNNGILVIRGDHSLAAAPEYKFWRQKVSEICHRVYIQAHPYSQQLVYCFIFDKENDFDGIYYAPSYLEDFSEINRDSGDWITLSSDEYSKFLCMYSDKEKSIFQDTVNPVPLKNKSWGTDFNKKILHQKVLDFQKEQHSQNGQSVIANAEKNKYKEVYIKAFQKPFVKKWSYINESDHKAWNALQKFGLEQNNPTICIGTNSSFGFNITLVNTCVLGDFFERKHQSNLLPYKIYKADGSYQENITDWALYRFKQYYLPRLPEAGKKSTVSSIKELLDTEIITIGRHTQRLPVLHKYTNQIIDIQQDDQNELDEIQQVLLKLQEKMLQLYRGATEKKKMISDINTSIARLSKEIKELGKIQIERQLKESELTKENIFYYCISLLHHEKYQSDYQKELIAMPPRIPLLDDFWKWAKIGKKLYQNTIQLNHQDILLEVIENDDFNKETDLKINSKQFIRNIHLLQNELKWGNLSLIDLIAQQYKERKPLNRSLRKFYQEKVSEVKMIELIKSIEMQSQIQVKLIEVMPEELFENKKAVLRLRKRT